MSYSRRSRYSRSPSYGRCSKSVSRSRYVSRSQSRSCDSSNVENPGDNLYVTGLAAHVKERDIEKHFSTEGEVEDVHLVLDPWTRESRGFGFVTMSSLDEADRCIKYLNRSVLEGRVITVEKARRRRGRTPTPGKYLGLRIFVVNHEVILLIQGVTLLVAHLIATGIGVGADPTLHITDKIVDPTLHITDKIVDPTLHITDKIVDPTLPITEDARDPASPYYSRHHRYSESPYSPYYSRGRSYSRSVSPYSRCDRSYSPDDRCYRRSCYHDYSPDNYRRDRSYSPDDRYYRRSRYRDYSPESRDLSYSPDIRYNRKRHYHDYSPDNSYYYRRSRYRSISRSISPRYQRSRRSYSRSVSPRSVSPRSKRSYSRSFSASSYSCRSSYSPSLKRSSKRSRSVGASSRYISRSVTPRSSPSS
ncbi:hypothetical protein RND71_024976 [Anisodus tanguticus]|uniref:RRM domain-containing protein n=1 Tax=Anisodus tanguticus TaxID=243964 RepID=A0AAE1VD09_9SOLA|nr:hypothetical protein RND71_024976 [Anisodus tanguticus]